MSVTTITQACRLLHNSSVVQEIKCIISEFIRPFAENISSYLGQNWGYDGAEIQR